MAGHSQFKNIMHRKGAADARRSKLFSKLAREITVAAKLGAPDPNMNSRLRLAILNARAENMPKDNIDRAIKKASGGEGENFEQVRYEGYGPGGVAVIVEALTDNRNRTAAAVRSYLSKAGGALGESGSVSFMFDRVGQIVYKPEAGTADQVIEAAINAGAEDVQSDAAGHIITTSFNDLGEVAKNLEGALGEAEIGEGRLAPADEHLARRGQGRGDAQARRHPGRRRRRSGDLLELRGLRRRHAEVDRGIAPPEAVPAGSATAAISPFRPRRSALRLCSCPQRFVSSE